jgi:hypothetical protein
MDEYTTRFNLHSIRYKDMHMYMMEYACPYVRSPSKNKWKSLGILIKLGTNTTSVNIVLLLYILISYCQ